MFQLFLILGCIVFLLYILSWGECGDLTLNRWEWKQMGLCLLAIPVALIPVAITYAIVYYITH